MQNSKKKLNYFFPNLKIQFCFSVIVASGSLHSFCPNLTLNELLQASLDALPPPVRLGRSEASAPPTGAGLESEEESLIDFTQSPPTHLELKIPKIILHSNSSMSEVTRIQEAKSESRPQSTTDSALGGSTSPDEASSAKTNDPNADSSFSADEREEENFESYGENEDSNLDFEA